MYALLTDLEKRFPTGFQFFPQVFFREIKLPSDYVQRRLEKGDVGSGSLPGGFLDESAFVREVVHLHESSRFFLAEDSGDFLLCPHVELAFFSLAVGVLRGIESTVRIGHVAEYVGQDFLGGLRESLVAVDLVTLQIGNHEERLIVEHLLEVGQKPAFVGGVAVDAQADLVVDSPEAYLGQGVFHHAEGVFFIKSGVVAQ